MVRTVDDPHSKNTKEFWLCAGYKAAWVGSGGIATLSGWITAFCFWDDKGNRNRAYPRELLDRTLEWAHLPFSERRPFELDGVEYPMFDPESLPTALITVPMTLEDHATQTKYTATVVAGACWHGFDK